MKISHPDVRLRKEKFARSAATRIWHEIPSAQNPYIAEQCRCHGYDLFELMQKRGFADIVYLLFRGELPAPDQSGILEALMVALINPGPRHPATRAAMNAGVGKTDPGHILPISLSVLSGAHLGGAEVWQAMRFLTKHTDGDPKKIAKNLTDCGDRPNEGDWHIAPGFGSRFGSIDVMPQKIASVLKKMPGSGGALRWGNTFAQALNGQGLGWLMTGVAAAVFTDLGFHPREGAGLFQIASSPGLLAHGLELADKPITAMPFIDEDHYVIETDSKES